MATLNDIPITFTAEHVETERALLAAGWLNPCELVNATISAGLTGSHFSNGRHSVVFAYLCGAADEGWHPGVEEWYGQDVTDCCRLAQNNGVDLSVAELDDLLFPIAADTNGMDELASDIVSFSARRSESRSLADHVFET